MIGTEIIYIIMIGLMMFLSAFFSGTETSIISSSRIYLENLASKGHRAGKRALYILDNVEKAISMILIGNNITNYAAAAFITFLAREAYLMDSPGLWAVMVIQTVVFLIFCEVSPKIIARGKAEGYLLFFSLPIYLLMVIMAPAIRVSLVVSRAVKNLFGLTETRSLLVKSRDEIDIMFRIGHQEGVIEQDYQRYISEILTFKKITAKEVMTPTIDIISVEVRQSIKDLVAIFARTKFSRIPVYQDRVDNIVGYVFYRDILKRRNVKKITQIMNTVTFVPSTKRISELYTEMQENVTPIFFVVNEYGAVVGMVTHEDIAEEVVGEIQARDQSEDDLITEMNNRKYILDGNLDIDYFMQYFNITVEKKGFETVAGLILQKMGRIPKKGEKIKLDRFSMEIDEATDRSIERVILHLDRKIKR